MKKPTRYAQPHHERLAGSRRHSQPPWVHPYPYSPDNATTGLVEASSPIHQGSCTHTNNSYSSTDSSACF